MKTPSYNVLPAYAIFLHPYTIMIFPCAFSFHIFPNISLSVSLLIILFLSIMSYFYAICTIRMAHRYEIMPRSYAVASFPYQSLTLGKKLLWMTLS